MKLSLFDYKLPHKLIAQTPAVPRDSARLLIYDRNTKKIEHKCFFDLPNYLSDNDVLVFNDSKVMPARLIGKKETGGRAEVLLLKQVANNRWEVLLGLGNPKIGLKLRFQHALEAQIILKSLGKTWIIQFNLEGPLFWTTLAIIGQVPLPPYIHSKVEKNLLEKQYQTVYANQFGSAAAPTAGLHFTARLLKRIQKTGCQLEYVTLHVGLGTFEPVNTNKIEDYQIHSEYFEVNKETIKRLIDAKKAGKRIIAVGTTSLRVLESLFKNDIREPKSIKQDTSIYIYPGYKFRFVDALISNFHLPKSSLLMLVSALIGRKNVIKIYQLAIRKRYKFFSFGDACFFK